MTTCTFSSGYILKKEKVPGDSDRGMRIVSVPTEDGWERAKA